MPTLARSTTLYTCQQCGAVQQKWGGRCEACGAWNALIEEVAARPGPRGRGSRARRPIAFTALEGDVSPVARRMTGIAEFDRVTGGGLVPGSALLIGGDPGIGKSTLLLQVAAAFERATVWHERIEPRIRVDHGGAVKKIPETASRISIRPWRSRIGRVDRKSRDRKSRTRGYNEITSFLAT